MSFAPVAGSVAGLDVGRGVTNATGVGVGIGDKEGTGCIEGVGDGEGVGVGVGVADPPGVGVGASAASAVWTVKVREIVRKIPSASFPVIVIVCCPGVSVVVG